MAEGIKPPQGGPSPGGLGGAAGKTGEAARVAKSVDDMKNAENGTQRVQHGAQAAADVGKNAGGLHGAVIGGVGQGAAAAAATKEAGGSGADQAKAAVKGAAGGAASGALAGRDGGAAEAAVGKVGKDVKGSGSDPAGDAAKAGEADASSKAAKAGEQSGAGGAGGAAEAAGDGADAMGGGAGGLMPVNPASEKAGDTDNAAGTGLKVAGAAAAGGSGAGQMGAIVFAANLLNYLKSLMLAGLAGMLNAASAFLAPVFAVLGAIGKGFAAVGSFISGALGGLVSATTAAIMAGIVAVAGVGIGSSAVVSTAQAANVAQRTDYLSPYCEVDQNTLDKLQEGVEVGDQTLANAKTVYSVLSAWGMPDENVAGILGNWKAESGIDPTSVQGYFSNKYTMTEEKKSAATNTDNGIGLGQWTFGRNQALRDASGSKDWWTIEAQLAFMIGKDSGAPVIKEMIATSEGSPAAAAKKFHDEWEISADTDISHREKAASEMFALMGSWEKNQSLADSVLELSGATIDDANSSRAKELGSREGCILSNDGGSGTLKSGGMTFEEAKAFMAKYDTGDWSPAYGTDCMGGAKYNCVAFSDYFVTNYTNGNSTSCNGNCMASSLVGVNPGMKLEKTPTVYSVFEYTSGVYGHTGVILGITDSTVIIGEANCRASGAPGPNQARELTKAQFEAEFGNASYAPFGDMLKSEKVK